MDRLTALGVLAVTLMLVTYALEEWARWATLAFACACALGSIYGFLQGGMALWRRGSLVGAGGAAEMASADDLKAALPLHGR